MPRGFGVKESVFDRPGLGVTAAAASGASQKIGPPVVFVETGSATVGGVGAGQSASVFVRRSGRSFPTTGLRDDFNRADGALGSNWSVRVFSSALVPTIAGNALAPTNTTNNHSACWAASTFASDVEVYATVGRWVDGDQVDLYARVTDENTAVLACYYVRLSRTAGATQVAVARVLDNSATTTSQATSDLRPGDTVGLVVLGGDIVALLRRGGSVWTLYAVPGYATLPAAPSGKIAVGARQTTAGFTVDDFGGGIPVAPAAGCVGSGASQFISGAGGAVYTKTGFATAGDVGAGPSASVTAETGLAVAGLAALGARQTDHVRTGFAIVGGVGSGVSQKVSGAGAVYTKAGFATVGGVGAGPSSSDEFSSGLAIVGLVGAGASASVFVETGFGTLGGVGSGFATRLGVQAKTGFATAGGVGSGARALSRTRSGYATTGLATTGASASVFAKTGAAIAGLVGAGSSARVLGGIVKSGFAAVGLTARGARAVSCARSGAGLAGLTAAGTRRVVYVEGGHAVIEGTGTGICQVSRVRTGFGTVGAVGAGYEFLPGRQPLPPGQILPPILGHIPAGLMPRIEQARTGRPAGPGRGTIITGQGGQADG